MAGIRPISNVSSGSQASPGSFCLSRVVPKRAPGRPAALYQSGVCRDLTGDAHQFHDFLGTGFLQTLLLQRLLDYTPALAGFIVLPGALVLAMMMLLAGRLTDIVDRRYIAWCG